jgi:hypothetical protein
MRVGTSSSLPIRVARAEITTGFGTVPRPHATCSGPMPESFSDSYTMKQNKQPTDLHELNMKAQKSRSYEGHGPARNYRIEV